MALPRSLQPRRHLTHTRFFTFCEALGRPAPPALHGADTKGSHAGLIPIAAARRPYLAEAMLSARGEYVFPDPEGRACAPDRPISAPWWHAR
jgi:hypothetical protein